MVVNKRSLQTISTKRSGSRVTATTTSGLKAVVPYDDEIDAFANHAAAATKLADRLHWGDMVGGSIKGGGHVFVLLG